jgi:hypothetical protein
MKFFRNLIVTSSAVLILSLPAFAGVNVNSPSNNASVSSPFTLSASASTCSSTGVKSMGWSFDSSSDTTVVYSQTINKSISSSTGTHVLHVKAWGSSGAACVTDVTINVTSSTSVSTTSSMSIPSYADSVSSIESLGGWRAQHDSGGAGTSTGSMSIVSSPSKYGSSRKFYTTLGVSHQFCEQDWQSGVRHKPDHGQRSNGHDGLSMRRLDRTLGLHRQHRQRREPQAEVGEQERYDLQSSPLVHWQVAPRSSQHVEG